MCSRKDFGSEKTQLLDCKVNVNLEAPHSRFHVAVKMVVAGNKSHAAGEMTSAVNSIPH